MKRHLLATRLLTDPILAFLLLFIVGPHNFTSFIQNIAECDEKQQTLIRFHYHTEHTEWLAVTELVNISNAHAQ
jgi:hypothetical protein